MCYAAENRTKKENKQNFVGKVNLCEYINVLILQIRTLNDIGLLSLIGLWPNIADIFLTTIAMFEMYLNWAIDINKFAELKPFLKKQERKKDKFDSQGRGLVWGGYGAIVSYWLGVWPKVNSGVKRKINMKIYCQGNYAIVWWWGTLVCCGIVGGAMVWIYRRVYM